MECQQIKRNPRQTDLIRTGPIHALEDKTREVAYARSSAGTFTAGINVGPVLHSAKILPKTLIKD